MTQPSSPQMNRRRWFAGAGTVGAVAAVAAVVPVATVTSSDTPAATPNKPSRGGGYTMSEHIKRYYQTTRV